jgi:hypothetical protein
VSQEFFEEASLSVDKTHEKGNSLGEGPADYLVKHTATRRITAHGRTPAARNGGDRRTDQGIFTPASMNSEPSQTQDLYKIPEVCILASENL